MVPLRAWVWVVVSKFSCVTFAIKALEKITNKFWSIVSVLHHEQDARVMD